jgi:hypothetical protein
MILTSFGAYVPNPKAGKEPLSSNFNNIWLSLLLAIALAFKNLQAL